MPERPERPDFPEYPDFPGFPGYPDFPGEGKNHKKNIMRKTAIILALTSFVAAQGITRSELARYAQSLQGLKKAELKTAAHGIMAPKKVLSYGSGSNSTWWGFYVTDRVPETGECINRYSARKFYFPDSNTGTAISGMNIEHSFPKSWWGGSSSTSAYKDLFNLYPSDSKANSSKSNYPMAIVTTVKEEQEGYDKVGTGTVDGVSGRNCWEPGDGYKGDFARAYMYMATAYQELTWQGTEGKQELETGSWPTLKPWAYTIYLRWLKSDPVDALELDRNEAVNSIQGNRNLFVDYPYLAEYIWGDSVDVVFNPYTSVSTATDDPRYMGSGEIVTVAKPTFSPDGSSYAEEVTVSIACATQGVTIYYTTDDSSPTTSSAVYTAPFTLSESATVKAIAVDGKGNKSTVATAIYTIYTSASDFAETFDLCSGTGGNDGQFGGQGVASSEKTYKTDNDGWTATSYFGGDRCARFGSGSNPGVVTTPVFTVKGRASFSFRAAPWSSDGTQLQVAVNGEGVSLSESSVTMVAGQWTDYSLTLTGQGSVSITFTPQKRFFLDEVYVRTLTLKGDINRDGTVTIADVTMLVNIILGKDVGQEHDRTAADVNGDGTVSIADVTALVNIILGK